MPMLTWLSMHPPKLLSWQGLVVIGLLVACVIALVIIAIKYR